MMYFRDILKKSTSLVLSLIFILTVFTPFAAYANQTDPFDVNFGAEGGHNNISIPPSEVLRMLYGYDAVSESEASYLDTYYENFPIYAADLYSDSVEFDVEGDTLTLKASKKSFETKNGQTLTWTPCKALYGEQEQELNADNGYKASFVFSSDASVNVEYTATLHLSEEYVLSLASFADADKKRASEIKAEHEAALAEYNQKNKEYRDYLVSLEAYDAAVRKRKEYETQKALYDERYAKYKNYIEVLLPEYEKKKAAYDAYAVAEKKYQSDLLTYEKNYQSYLENLNAYKAYIANLDKIRASMVAIESIYVKPSNGVGTLFGALQNAEIIAMIEKNQDTLVTTYGVKRDDVVQMRKASDDLLAHLIAYEAARNTSEEAAFAYYKQHYSEITNGFNYLYQKMRAVLNDTIYSHVCALFEIQYGKGTETAKYKIWRVNNVLCHIYLICNVLDDTKTAAGEWEFYQRGSSEPFKYSFSDLLGQNVILADTNNASPVSLNWISGDFSVTEEPQMPVRPTEVKEPVKPSVVSEPNEPAFVPEPEPVAPVEPPPSEAPKMSEPALVARVERYLSEQPPTARQLPQSTALTVKKTVAVFTSGDKIYCNYDGTILDPEKDTPTRPSTEQCVYVFTGHYVPIEEGSRIYVPVFEEQPRGYTAIYKNGDQTLGEKPFVYGDKPEDMYDGETPTRQSDNDKVYTFCGWALASKGEENWEYTAQFSSSTRYYHIKWKLPDKTVESGALEYGDALEAPTVPQTQYIGNAFYEFKGWSIEPSDKIIQPEKNVSRECTYVAQFKITELASLPTDSVGNVEFAQYENEFILKSDTDKIKLGGLVKHVDDMQKADSVQNQIIIDAPTVTLLLDSSAVSSLAVYGATEVEILHSRSRNASSGIGYVFTNNQGKVVNFNGNVTMTFENTLGTTDNLYVKGTLENGAVKYIDKLSASMDMIELVASPNVIYTLHRYYSLTVKSQQGGAVFAEKTLYREGDTVKLDIRPNAEYTIGKLSLSGALTSFSLEPKQKSFKMPADDLVLDVEFLQKLYNVIFIVDGEVVSSTQHAFGEQITAPEVPLTFEKDGFIYSFVGWSQAVGMVTGDVTYTAKYTSVRADLKRQPAEGSALRRVILEQVIPIACLLVLLGGAVTLLCIVSRKAIKLRKKQAKGKKHDKKV